jgi:Holliday junction resolvase RusA-like endonuclease
VSVYTDAETRNYEAMLRFYGQQAMKAAGHTVPFNCPLRVRVTSVFPIPASWSPKKAVQADCGLVRPTVKPDWENLAKTLDGVNGVVWRDDSLIVEGIIHKLYGRNPMLTVEVWRWVPTHKQQEMPLVSAG